jgi:predicted Holliday junction resolvase-like endonuclease
MSCSYEDLGGHAEQRARTLFAQWVQNEQETARRAAFLATDREYRLKLEQWKVDAEASIRADARQRSQSVISGAAVCARLAYLQPQGRAISGKSC